MELSTVIIKPPNVWTIIIKPPCAWTINNWQGLIQITEDIIQCTEKMLVALLLKKKTKKMCPSVIEKFLTKKSIMMAIQFTAHQSGKKHQKYLIWYHTGKGNTGRRKHQITWSYFLYISWTQVKEEGMTGKKSNCTKHMEPKAYSIRVVLHHRALKFSVSYTEW